MPELTKSQKYAKAYGASDEVVAKIGSLQQELARRTDAITPRLEKNMQVRWNQEGSYGRPVREFRNFNRPYHDLGVLQDFKLKHHRVVVSWQSGCVAITNIFQIDILVNGVWWDTYDNKVSEE